MAPHILQLQGAMHSSPLKSAVLSIPVSLNSAFVQGSESGLWSDPDFIANLNLLSSFLIVCTNEPVLSFYHSGLPKHVTSNSVPARWKKKKK